MLGYSRLTMLCRFQVNRGTRPSCAYEYIQHTCPLFPKLPSHLGWLGHFVQQSWEAGAAPLLSLSRDAWRCALIPARQLPQVAGPGAMQGPGGRCLPSAGVDVVPISRPIGSDTEGGAGAAHRTMHISRAVRQLARPQEPCNIRDICFPRKAKCKVLPALMTRCSSPAGRGQCPWLPPPLPCGFNLFLSPVLLDVPHNFHNVDSVYLIGPCLSWNSLQQPVET